MWPGPYGEWGSRKYFIASFDQSLERMGVDMSTSSITIGLIPKRRWKKPWARWIRLFGAGKRSIRDFQLSTRTDPKSATDLKTNGNTLSHSSAKLQHVQPVD